MSFVIEGVKFFDVLYLVIFECFFGDLLHHC